MEQRISLVTLGVKDLAVSKKFYVQGLGWKPVWENKEIVFFQTGGMIFALFLRDELATDFQANAASFGLAAMALAYNDWSGSTKVRLAVEGHGREDIAEGLDLTRTVGWFTSIYPVAMEVKEGGAIAE